MILCYECFEKPFACGQAFTKFICPHCLKDKMHGNTGTPRLCKECAEKLGRCQRCLKKLKSLI